MARARYRSKKKGHRKSQKRVRAGKKAWRTRVRRHGRHGGGKRRGRAKRVIQRGTGRLVRSRRHGRRGRRGNIAYCSAGRCARRPIFGGAKGLATHRRRHHRGRR